MELTEQLSDVGILADAARRALYEHVVGQDEPVSREQAAAAVGVPVHSAKFHLDKLASGGLLEVEYRRLSGRSGPGAGRPSKLYRRADREVSVSVPPRRYDLVGEVLAGAVERSVSDGTDVAEAVAATARQTGRSLVTAAAGEGADELTCAAEALARHGYRPRVEDGELSLSNCPFHRLAAEHTALVCSLNLALVGGVLEALGTATLRPRLAPAPGSCCVRVSAGGTD